MYLTLPIPVSAIRHPSGVAEQEVELERAVVGDRSAAAPAAAHCPDRSFGPLPGVDGGVGGAGVPGGPSSVIDDQLIAYLEANRGDATWIVAVRSANEGAAIQLASGEPVMATGGFSGGDSALTLDQVQFGGRDGPGSAGSPGGGDSTLSSGIDTWITEHGTVVEAVGSGALYDLSGAATEN